MLHCEGAPPFSLHDTILSKPQTQLLGLDAALEVLCYQTWLGCLPLVYGGHYQWSGWYSWNLWDIQKSIKKKKEITSLILCTGSSSKTSQALKQYHEPQTLSTIVVNTWMSNILSGWLLMVMKPRVQWSLQQWPQPWDRIRYCHSIEKPKLELVVLAEGGKEEEEKEEKEEETIRTWASK
jgi:hypothetical protein